MVGRWKENCRSHDGILGNNNPFFPELIDDAGIQKVLNNAIVPEFPGIDCEFKGHGGFIHLC